MSPVREAAPLRVSERDGVRLLTLHRPQALNAITRDLAATLAQALDDAGRDRGIRAVVLIGSGDRAFSTGVDLEEAAALTPAEVPAWFTILSECYRRVLCLDKPVVAALNGLALGGGYQLGLVSDWRIGHLRTRLGQPEVNAGVPSIMGSYLMRFYLPHGLNQELSYTGRLLHAEEGRRLGLLNELVPPEELEEAAFERAREFAHKPALAFRETKARFRDHLLEGFDAARAAAIAGMQAAFAAGEPQAAMAAFLARRR